MFIIDIDHIGIEEVVYLKDKIRIKGILLSSGESYKSGSFKKLDDTVFIKLNGRFAFGFLKSNDIIVFEPEGDFSNINKVYLEDEHKSKLIWSTEHYDIKK